MTESVLIDNNGPVRIVTINRPDRRNAVDTATAQALFDAFHAFDADETASVAILTGVDGAFCAGADLKALSDGDGDGRITEEGENSRAPMGVTRMALSKPVIAAVEGHAVAGGMELALWCDLRVMARDATFGIFCRRFGVPLIDGGTFRLPRLIGQSRAMDLVLTGRPVAADEALTIGLANRVSEPSAALADAVALAHEIAKFPQACMRNDRLSIIQQWGMDHDAAIRNETRLGLETIHSGETLDGATRFAGGDGRHGSFDKH